MIADLPGIPASVRAARALAAEAIGAGHPAADAIALCVSELVTNAIAHSRSALPGATVCLAVAPVDGHVYVRVTDAGGGSRPALADPAPDAEHGRGLRIIAALSTQWGTSVTAAGRATWCWIEGSKS